MPTGPMQPMPESSTSYMLQYSALPGRNHANEQKKYFLMLKDQYRHVDKKQRETVTQLQTLNLELFSLIRSNQNFMLTSKFDSLKRDISEVETKKAELEKEKTELTMKLKKFLQSSDGTDSSAVVRDLSVSSGSPSPLAENSPPDTLRPKVHVSLSPLLLGLPLDLPVHVSPSVHGTPSPLVLPHSPHVSKPTVPPMQDSKSPVLLTNPPDVCRQVSPSVLTHQPDVCIPVSPPTQGPQSLSVLTPPPNVSPDPGTSPVNNSSGNSVPCKVDLSDRPKEPRKLPPENYVKAKENRAVSKPARSPHRESNTLTQRPLEGAVGVTSSAAASQAGTSCGLANGGDVAGYEAPSPPGGAETGGAETGGATNKSGAGGAAICGAAPQASGGSAATGGTSDAVANGTDAASGDAPNNATTSEMNTSNSASTHSAGVTGAAMRGTKHSSTGVTSGANQSSAGGTTAPEAAVPVQHGGQKLKDWLAAIHWQKEEEQRKIRELKEARGVVVSLTLLILLTFEYCNCITLRHRGPFMNLFLCLFSSMDHLPLFYHIVM